MPVDITVPSVGESITEGTIARWLKPDGAMVRANEPIVELDTDKASQEVMAPASGVLSIGVKEGERVSIGAVIGRIDERATAPAPKEPAAPAPPPVRRDGAPAPAEKVLSPAARQIAATQGIDTGQLTGTGRGGRIIKEDVLASQPPPPSAPPKPAPPPAAPPPQAREAPRPAGRETRQRMSPIRQRIGERLLAAQQNAAILTTFNEIDMSAVIALRAKYKESFQNKHGVGLGFMSFFVKAAVEALQTFPVVNSRIDGDEIVTAHYHDIGVAVSTDRGLMVPVLRDAGSLSFAGIEKAIGELAAKARDGKITVADLQGGTFTITNGGIFGSLLSTPILNPPQSAILGMHAIQKRPVAVDDEVVIRPMMYVALSYDHRLIDGREAVGFLVRIKECVENPERLLLEV
jgi:2-oxoglutarate dehydrogenase E2 component (dihydrolipoamide succinyltransferase)